MERQMNDGRQRIIEALNEAHGCEQTHEQVLQEQIAAAPRGRYRKGLQTHLRETRDHTQRLERRMGELKQRENVFQLGLKLVESGVGQGLALGRAPLALGRTPLELLAKSPLNLLRGQDSPAKVLDDAKDACATEALEIARYRGIEGLAQSAGDRQTARLAASIRGDEERMLDHLVEEIPSLVTWVVDADVRGKASASVPQGGATKAARSSRARSKKVASRGGGGAKRAAGGARAARPPALQADAQPAGAPASEPELPIANYGALTADQVVEMLPGLSRPDLAKIDTHEREHENRPPILSRISILRSVQAPGGEQPRVAERITAGAAGDRDQPAPLRSYHDMGETRESILAAAERELTST
jgi:ferritin-like metal-binding protein YciE